ncbi:hypothetical protein SprV_0200657200 [Sparganum proliferum]
MVSAPGLDHESPLYCCGLSPNSNSHVCLILCNNCAAVPQSNGTQLFDPENFLTVVASSVHNRELRVGCAEQQYRLLRAVQVILPTKCRHKNSAEQQLLREI